MLHVTAPDFNFPYKITMPPLIAKFWFMRCCMATSFTINKYSGFIALNFHVIPCNIFPGPSLSQGKASRLHTAYGPGTVIPSVI